MEKNIPEIEARNILLIYEGFNNQILDWKFKLLNQKKYTISRSQSEYILKYHNIVPKIAKKYITITKNFGEKLMEEKIHPSVIEKIWCEKLLCESEKAYHIWGRILETENISAFWLPKFCVIQEERKLNREIDYSPYSHREPMKHQKEAIEKLLVNNKFILADDMGLGKFLTNNTLIYTELGIKKMGEIVIGDRVIGSNGKPCNVIGVFPQGIKDTYKITFSDGYSIISGDEHLWSVSSPNYGKNTKNERLKKSLILSTKQMFEGGVITIKGDGYNSEKNYNIETYYKSPNGNNKWQIPIVKPIEFINDNKLPIDPYLLGLGLGDGSFNGKNIRFSLHKDDYDELFSNHLLKENKPQDNKRNGYINVGESLFDLGIEHTRSHNKFIPEIYKYSSIENRLAILQGLMDTDGYCMISKNGSFMGTEYSTISEKLCDDVCEIVQTLGGIARKKSRRGFYKKDGKRVECSISYRVNIKLPSGMNPFRLKRKSERYNEPQKYPTGRYIKNIEKIGQDECTCISVDAPDKLYVAEHCIVTHNTTSSIIASLESGAKKILIICPASLKINWKREIENYSDKKVLIVDGKKWDSSFDYFIINYDIIKNYHTIDKEEEIESYKLISNEKFDLVIIDEAHYISNSTAQRTKLINNIVTMIPKVWLLTGTPMTSRPINFYNLLKIVESPVALNWQGYVRRYCAGYQFNVGGKKIWNTNGASNLDELREKTKNIILRRMKNDILDLPEKLVSPVFLDLVSTFYNEELEEFIRITKDNKNKESISVTINRLMKIRQVIASEKVPYTCELIDKVLEQGKKVIVFTNFTSSLDMLHEKYKKNSVTLDGRMSKEKRQQNVDKFQNEDKVKIFISNIKAGGVGITLTSAEVVIMNDLSFVPSDHSQAEDRAYRYGQKNSVLVYYPIFENTIEMIVYNILQKKKNVIEQVMGDGEYSKSFANSLLDQIF
jgi:superfamily II DNA or RNA helicase